MKDFKKLTYFLLLKNSKINIIVKIFLEITKWKKDLKI